MPTEFATRLDERLTTLDTDGTAYTVAYFDRVEVQYAVSAHGPGWLEVTHPDYPGATMFVNADVLDSIVVQVS